MTERAETVFSRVVAAVTGGGLVSLLRTRTIVVLVLLLLALVAGIELARPGTVNALWASNMMLFAAPLGIVAAGQTLVMLTGGIDLSVASVATASAYLMASHSGLGGAPAVLYGLGVGFAVGLINGIGIALLRVQPLVMTLGTGLMTEGMLVVYSQKMMANAPRVPQFIEDLGAGKFLGGIPNDLFLWAPIAIVIIFLLRRTGYGRLLSAKIVVTVVLVVLAYRNRTMWLPAARSHRATALVSRSRSLFELAIMAVALTLAAALAVTG